jgi:hypothetical protein
MAVTTIQSNNKLIKFTQDINREFVRNNLFSPTWVKGWMRSFAPSGTQVRAASR